MTSQLSRFWCFFAAGSWEKDIKNGAAVTSLRSFLFCDDFSGNKPFNFSYLDISHKLLTTYAVHTIFHTQPSPPMLVLTPFVPRDSFIKADAQQIQLMYFPATYPPTTYLATYTIIHSVGNTFFFSNVLYFSIVLINMKTISVEYRTRLGIAVTTEFSEENKFLISDTPLVYVG